MPANSACILTEINKLTNLHIFHLKVASCKFSIKPPGGLDDFKHSIGGLIGEGA